MVERRVGMGSAGRRLWQDQRTADRLAGRLERWLGLMRMHGGSERK